MPDKEVVIVNGARTAIGRFGGALRDLTVIDIGVVAVKGALEKSGVKPEQVDEVIIGHARQAGGGPNAARIVSVNAGIPASTPAYAVNVACVSGMLSIILAYQSITLGNSDIVLAGGMEHHSSIPFLNMNMRWGMRMGDVTLVDALYKDGYHCGIEHQHMGALTDDLARELGITREEQDRFALESQQKVAKAKESGFFAKTIIPIEVPQAKGAPILFQEDEAPRPDTTLEVLAKLRLAFRPDGTITAGNSPPITDGASAVVVASRDKASELGLKPLARILSYAVTAVEAKPPPERKVAVADIQQVREFLTELPSRWASYSRTLRNRLLKLLIDRVELRHDTQIIEARIIWRAGLEQKVTIYRPKTNGSRDKRWTNEEDALLRMLWPSSSKGAIQAALPNRSWKSICCHAYYLKLRRQRGSPESSPQRPWKSEDEDRARVLYESGVPLEEIVAELGRQRTAILNKASKRGWHRPQSAKWQKAEITWAADNLKVLQSESSGR